jgi:hypothetical protein
MDDRQTNIKNKEQTTQDLAEEADVLEFPDREIRTTDRTRLRYGTIGQGTDLARLVWPLEEHVLSVMDKDLRSKLSGRPEAQKEYVTGRFNTKKLKEAHLDCLLVEGNDPGWWRWMGSTADPN